MWLIVESFADFGVGDVEDGYYNAIVKLTNW